MNPWTLLLDLAGWAVVGILLLFLLLLVIAIVVVAIRETFNALRRHRAALKTIKEAERVKNNVE